MKDILHFGGLKMRFLEVAETFCSRLHGCRWKHIWHFGGLKMRFLAGLVTNFFTLWRSEKRNSFRFVKPSASWSMSLWERLINLAS